MSVDDDKILGFASVGDEEEGDVISGTFSLSFIRNSGRLLRL